MASDSKSQSGAASLLHSMQAGLDKIMTLSIALGSVWIAGLVLVVVIDVVGRILFNSPLQGAFEITTFSIIGIVYLQLAHTIRSRRMTKSDLLSSLLASTAPRVWRAIECLFLVLCSAVFILLTVYVAARTQDAWIHNKYYGSEGAIRFASWPIYLVATLGCACSSLQYVLLTLFAFLNEKPSPVAAPFSKEL